VRDAPAKRDIIWPAARQVKPVAFWVCSCQSPADLTLR